MQVLIGDIGGTNTRLIYVELSKRSYNILFEKTYPSKNYKSLDNVITRFFLDANIETTPDAARFAVAGPVVNGVSNITNLPWVINEQQISDDFKIPQVFLVNDFKAVAYGINLLTEEDILVLQEGSEQENKTSLDAAIIGAGTGLGVSHRVWIDKQYCIFSSETGHTGYAPETALQCQLLQWLLQQYSHVSLELLLSGQGLYTIYRFLLEQGNATESPLVLQQLKQDDPAKVITDNALAGTDELCQQVVDMFVEIYGAAAGNAVLIYYPVDELYIAGGIAPRIKDKMAGATFLDAFKNKGLMYANMENIAIKLILDNRVGLYGALSLIHKDK